MMKTLTATLVILFSLQSWAQHGSGVSTSRLPIEEESSKSHRDKKKTQDRQEEQAMEKESVLGSGSSVKFPGEPKTKRR